MPIALARILLLALFSIALVAAAADRSDASSSRASASKQRGAVKKKPARRGGRPVARQSIVGGRAASADWPWMTALLRSEASSPTMNDWERQFCGGALIAPAVVLTAAHCVINENGRKTPEQVEVLLGRRTLRAGGGEKIALTKIEVHPQYEIATHRNDVALLHLARSSAATPAELIDPARPLYEGERGTLQGWGQTVEGDASSGAEALLEADLPLWSTERCRSSYSSFDAASGFCAGYVDGMIDACQGDSGGPLMLPDGGRWRLLGVVSYGKGCARPGYPTVYAWLNAEHLRSFILEGMRTPEPPAPAPGPAASPAPADEQPAPVPVAATATRDEVAPAILTLSLAPRRFRAGRGTWIRSRLTEAATLRFSILRSDRRGRTRRVGSMVARSAASGVNRFRLTGRAGGRRMRAGRYVLAVVAVDAAGNASMSESATFRISRR